MVGFFCVCKMYYARNGGGNAFIRKCCFNNYHVEVNLEACEDMVCSPPTTIFQLNRLQTKYCTVNYDELHRVVKLQGMRLGLLYNKC